MGHAVLVLLVGGIIFGALTLMSVLAILAQRRTAPAAAVEQPYVMGAQDATSFEQIVARSSLPTRTSSPGAVSSLITENDSIAVPSGANHRSGRHADRSDARAAVVQPVTG
jgi:hypothetical protein